MANHLNAWNALFIENQSRDEVLLLKRPADKKIFPNRLTGIGGGVELEQGEGRDIDAATLRELDEETVILPGLVTDFLLRLVTLWQIGEETRVIYWYTAIGQKDLPLNCDEGTLDWYSQTDLPLETMTPTAREALLFILSLSPEDQQVHSGVYHDAGDEQLTLTIAQPNV